MTMPATKPATLDRRMTRIERCAVVALIMVVAVMASPIHASLAPQIKQDTEWLCSQASRQVGSEGHDHTLQQLLTELQAIGGIHLWTHDFTLLVPEVVKAELEISEDGSSEKHRVYPFLPASVRLNSTPKEGISGELVYVGKGSPAELPARSLRNQIAVMEMAGAWSFVEAHNSGAEAVVLIGSATDNFNFFEPHLFRMPINVPRFYVPPGALAERLRSGNRTKARLLSDCYWREATATNIYVLVKGSEGSEPQQAIVIAVPFDSMSLVPELSPGADAAVDVAFALNLIRSFAKDPPARPVVFAFLDAFGNHSRGMREMLLALCVAPDDRKDFDNEDRRTLREYMRHWELARDVESEDDPLESLSEDKYKILHRYLKDEVSREVVAIESELFPLRVAQHRASSSESVQLKGRIDILAERRTEFFAAQRQMLTRVPIAPTMRPLASTLWKRSLERIKGQLSDIEDLIETTNVHNRMRSEMLSLLGLPQSQQKPLGFVLGLDLSDTGVAVGPSLTCRYSAVNETGNSQDFRRWLNTIQKREYDEIWQEPIRRAVTFAPLLGLDSPDSYIVGENLSITWAAGAFGLAGMTWTTLEGFRSRVGTPNDLHDSLDWERLNPQIDATVALLDRLCRQSDFQQTTKILPKWTRVRGTIVDQSAGEPVPRLPMKGYVTTLINGGCNSDVAGISWLPNPPGIQRQEFRFTKIDGSFLFDAMPGNLTAAYGRFYAQSYLLAEDGSILRAVDIAKGGKGVNPSVDTASRMASPPKAVVFDCEEMTQLGLFDPRFMWGLPGGTVLDAARAGKPQRLNFSLSGGHMVCQLEPGTRWQGIFRVGTTRNRMCLLNMMDPDDAYELPERQAMKGFSLKEKLPSLPIHVGAKDMSALDEVRLRKYRTAGITSEAIDRLRVRTTTLLQEAEKAIQDDDGGTLYNAAAGAQANEIRAYQAVRDLADDIVRAAIFLLIALAPFSYAMERLLIASTNIYKQIAGMAIIFCIMTAILWSFHPAFRMSSQPLMIVMAFGIIFMSLLVITVVYAKFETGLEEMRTGRTEGSGASTSRVGVLSSAIRLGIANMRNRMMRTTLTGATVVLITFVLLCFTSTSSYVGQKERRVPVSPSYAGVLIHQPSHQPMSGTALTYLQTLSGKDFPVLPRLWWCNPWNPQWKIHVYNPATDINVSLTAGVGLNRDEDKATQVRALLPNWDTFRASGGCYLSEQTAEDLALKPGDDVLITGRILPLIGVFDAAQFDTQLLDLDGQSWLPIDYSALGGDMMRLSINTDMHLLESQMETGQGMETGANLTRLSSNNVIIVPDEFLYGMRDCSMRSVAIATTTHAEAAVLGKELGQRLAFPIYFSTANEVRVYASTILLPSGPKSLLVPLAIGGLIILNTMLGAIAERRRDIYIYTSMGLAPLHVGVLFLAEAATYGLMGSIFGYIVGQGVATVFSKMGLLAGITLNYSGTHAVMTMFMVMVVVVFSSLLPAYMAGKLAVPSANMSWKVPAPVDDRIRDILPFTVTEKTANGVVLFLYEYLEAHRDGAIGHFTTDDLKTFTVKADDIETMGIEGTAWLVPYDLGVRQNFKILVRPTGDDDVCEMTIELQRGSGQVSTWHNLNKVFLADLRKQLLGWRKLKLERMLQYITASAERTGRSLVELGIVSETESMNIAPVSEDC